MGLWNSQCGRDISCFPTYASDLRPLLGILGLLWVLWTQPLQTLLWSYLSETGVRTWGWETQLCLGLALPSPCLYFQSAWFSPSQKKSVKEKERKKKREMDTAFHYSELFKKKKRKILKYCNYCDRTDVIQKGLLTDTLEVNRIFSKVYWKILINVWNEILMITGN